MASIAITQKLERQIIDATDKLIKRRMYMIQNMPLCDEKTFMEAIIPPEIYKMAEELKECWPNKNRQPMEETRDFPWRLEDWDVSSKEGAHKVWGMFRANRMYFSGGGPYVGLWGAHNECYVIHRDHPLYPEARAWLEACEREYTEGEFVRGIIGDLLFVCRTVGHLRLMWPDSISILPQDVVSKLGPTVARSLPEPGLNFSEDGAEKYIEKRTKILYAIKAVSNWLAFSAVLGDQEPPGQHQFRNS